MRLYYQSTSKEFVEFLRDENSTNTKGQEMYDLWNNNGKCPPTLMGEAVWVPIFELSAAGYPARKTADAVPRAARRDLHHRIRRQLGTAPVWREFANNGSFTATNKASVMEDDFTANTSGAPSLSGQRFYRFKYNGIP